MKKSPLILASASPRRAELLRQSGVKFRVETADVEELHNEHLTARELARFNAGRKAEAVAKKFPNALVLGADTLVFLGTKLFGKPKDLAEARRMLRELQGRTHQVVTGVCLMCLQERRRRTFSEITDVKFRRLSAAQIDKYLAQMNPLDKAGGYAIQERGEMIVEKISGSFSNVVGLPLERLRAELAEWD